MSEQFWIGGFFVDLPRNQITHNNKTQTLAPKALAVLTHLARHQGQVVSQDALLDEVWANTVVSPNTLQRSIAQLRKAFGDDGKEQNIIKTHAKQGYSLECDVRWQLTEQGAVVHIRGAQPQSDAETPHPESSLPHNNAQTSLFASPLKMVTVGVFAALFAFIAIMAVMNGDTEGLTVKEIRTITATDNKEHSGAYSPDGQYILFHRYSDVQCTNNIWAKNVDTLEEIQLTSRLEAYGGHSISPDGKTFAFVKEQDCTAPVTQKKCYFLMTLDFQKALDAPQTPTQQLECKHSRIRRPLWLSNTDVALLKQTGGQWRLIRYAMPEQQMEVLFTVSGGNIISYDYSAKQKLFGITAVHEDGEYYLDRVSLDGQLISSHRIQYPDSIAKQRYISPRFTNVNDDMIFSTGYQLYWLASDGSVSSVSLPLSTPVGSPVFHPEALRMLVISGHYDSDLAAFELASFDSKRQQLNGQVLHRSNVGEYYGMYQPNGEAFAFTSSRSGGSQLWLSQNGRTVPLTAFPKDSYIDGIVWAKDGQRLLVNATKTLYEVTIEGKVTAIETSLPISQLLEWDSEHEIAYVNVSENGVVKFAQLDLATGEFDVNTDVAVKFARLSTSGELLFQDKLDRIWRPGALENELIEPLVDQGSDRGFVVAGETLYGVNDDFELWSYALETDEMRLLGELSPRTDFITYADEKSVITSFRVSAKKEVAEVIFEP